MSIPPKVTRRSINGLSGFRNGTSSDESNGNPAAAPLSEVEKPAKSSPAERTSSKPDVSRGDIELRADTDIEKVLAVESLPVLDAFRKFIDKERLRVRRTVLGLSGVFVVAMILVLSVAGLIGKAFFGDLTKDMEADRTALRETQGEFEEMRTVVSETTRTFNDALEDVEKERSSARQKLAELYSNMAETRRNMAGLGSRITGMETLGDSGLEDLEISFRILTNQVETLFFENSALRSEIQALNARYQGARVAEPVGRAVPLGIFLDMTPSNTNHRVTWRLPDPS